MPDTATETVRIGTTFHHVFADGRPLWEVTAKVSAGVWRAVVPPTEYEHNGETYVEECAGATDVFDERVILAELRSAAFFEQHAQQEQAARDAIAVGATVHRLVDRSDANLWQRCTVVEVTQDDIDAGRSKHRAQVGEKRLRVDGYVAPQPQRLRPLTLTAVGDVHNPNLGWRHDEPGDLVTFRTDALWESDDFRHRDKAARDGQPLATDPTGCDLHEWDVPTPTAIEAQLHAKNRTVRAIQQAVSAGRDGSYDPADPQATLDAVAALLDD